VRLRALLLILSAAAAQADYAATVESERVRLDNGDSLRVTIAPPHGGELAGMEFFFDGAWRELVYRANDYSAADGWRGKAPVLWPAVGLTRDAADGERTYRLDGRKYPMPAHGFARDRAWRVVRHGAAADHAYATLAISDDAASRAMYPFEFELLAEYRVLSDRLTIDYVVRAGAGNATPMPFCIGNHVTFRAPLLPGAEAAEIRFGSDLPDYLPRSADRTFSGRVEPSPYRGEHPLSDLPHRSAVGLGGGSGPAELTLVDPSGLRVTLRHETSRQPAPPAIRFNLWADTEAGFFSPEPWLGTQNCLNTGAGAVRLEPGADWRWRIEIIPSGKPGPQRNEDVP